MKIAGILLLSLLALLLLFVAGLIITLLITPMPLVKKMRQGDNVPPSKMHFPPDYAIHKDKVRLIADLSYPSQFHNNTYDLYLPKGGTEKCPTILWVHGGSFVAGTKRGTENVMTMLAARGYAVVSMDYALVPEAKHPTPVKQMQEMYQHLCTVDDSYPQVDAKNLFIGGDSAGAQIASEFIAAQTNEAFAAELGVIQCIPAGCLRGAILTCGPYHLAGIRQADNRLLKILLWFLGRAMFDGRPWYESPGSKQAATAVHVTEAYPPTFLTDGNSVSFEVQGRRLGEALRGKGVTVQERYFDLETAGEVPHNFLFELGREDAQHCLQEICDFVQSYRKTNE